MPHRSEAASNPVMNALQTVRSKGRGAAARVARRVRPSVSPPPRTEEAKLRGVWAGYRQDMLERYLVSGYQDPRINAQSILARHTLVRALFGDDFEPLMREELAFAVE